MAAWRDRLAAAEWQWVLALSILALGLRTGYVLSQQRGFYFEDSLDYDRAARAFLESGHFDPKYYRFPLYPLFMAGSYQVFGSELAPFRLLQALLGTGTCLAVWAIARRLFGTTTGLLALFAASIFPVHIVLAGIEYPVSPGTFLIWLVLWILVVREQSEGKARALLVAAGLGAGLCAMLFEGGLGLCLFTLLCVLIRSVPWRTRLGDAGILVAGALLLLGPWAYTMIRSGDYRPLVLKAGIHLPTAPGVQPPLWKGSGENLIESKLAGLAQNPGWTIRHFGMEFLHFWNPYPDRLTSADSRFRKRVHDKDARMVINNALVGDLPRVLYAFGYGTLLIAAAAGAIAAFQATRGVLILVLWPVVLGFCYAPFFTQMRYRIPADPAFIILGAYAVESAMQKTLLNRIISFFKALWAGWKKIAEKIMIFWTFVLLLLLFVLVVGPIAILMKVFRKDPMHAPMAPGSFWALRDRTREGMEECLRQF
jgi:4-amino-4-deoxy-L-arabinose transferase-like glycosyltransferase